MKLAEWIKQAGTTQQALADAIDFSQGRIAQIIAGEKASPELAIAIHRFTGGAVPGSTLRPDLWRRPEDVPTEPAEATG